MRRTGHKTWILPLLTVAAVALVFYVAASRLNPVAFKKDLARQYGVSEETVEEVAGLLPPDWQFGDPIELEDEAHPHTWPAGVEVIEDETTGVTLTFAHLGDGHFAGQDEPLQTSYTIVNNTRKSAAGTIHFFQDDASPLELEIDGVTDSSFPFQLQSGSQQRFTTSGAGDLKSGWTRIRSNQPLVVTSSFGAIREDGTVISDVGVGESELGTEFTIFADTIGTNDTGVALTNPHDDDPVDIEMTLRDAGGVVVAQEQLHLEPRGHTALFVHQLFPEVPGIREFEGTVVLKSTTAAAAGDGTLMSRPAGEAAPVSFVGLTLRISGTVFTSVPMVPPPAPDADHTKLGFPQAADGEAGDLSVSTTPVIFNVTDREASGVIEFFKGDGSFNEVRVGGVATSAIPFEIPPRGVFRVDTDGVGELAVGWARVTMDQPLAGVAIFTIKDKAGGIVAAVGVNSALLRSRLEFIADTRDLFDTALAIVNPLEIPEHPMRLRVALKDTAGFAVAPVKTIDLAPREHVALFLTQLFPEVEGIDEFEGRLEVVFGGSGRYVIALSLRSALEKLTSQPVFSEKHAFSPAMTAELASSVRSASPSLKWALHQSRGDLAVRHIEAAVDGLRLHTEGLRIGTELGSGYQDRPDQHIQLLAREVGEGFLEYDLVFTQDEVEVRAQGLIRNLLDGVQFTMTDLDALPATNLFLDTDMVVHFAGGLFEIQEEAEEVSVNVVSTSVSQSTRADLSVRHRSLQTMPLKDPDPILSDISEISTPWLTTTELITIQGTKFGDAPRVVFPGRFGATISVDPLEAEEGQVSVFVPAGVTAGQIRIDNGNGPGAGYTTELFFAPVFSLQQEAGTDKLKFELRQEGDVLRMEEIFEFRVYEVGIDVGQLEVGQRVGISYNTFPSPNGGLFVKSIDGDVVRLEIAPEPGIGVTGELILESLADDILAIRTPPENQPSETLVLGLRSYLRVVELEGLPLSFPNDGEIVFASSWVTSGPAEPGSTGAALIVAQADAFLR